MVCRWFRPSLSYSGQIDGDSAWGVAFYGNGGMNTAYSAFANPNCGGGTGVFCGGKAGVDLTQAFLSVGYARKFGALSVGVAPVLAVQRFKANGLAAFAGNSSNAAALTNNGFDYAYGAGIRGGVQWDATKSLRFGLSGATPIYSTKFDKYAGLFADRGGFDIPGNIALGVAWDALPTLTLLAQYKRVFYSGTGSVGNSSLIAQPFGVAGGPGFGWKDVDLVSIGAEWKATTDLTLRAGYAKNTNPVRSAHVALNILAPGVVTDHFTGGFTYKVTQNSNVDFAVVYAPKHTISGPIPLAFGGGNAKLRLSEFEATIGYTYTFDTATAVVAKY